MLFYVARNYLGTATTKLYNRAKSKTTFCTPTLAIKMYAVNIDCRSL